MKLLTDNYLTTCFHVLSLYFNTKSLTCQVVTMCYMCLLYGVLFNYATKFCDYGIKQSKHWRGLWGSFGVMF